MLAYFLTSLSKPQRQTRQTQTDKTALKDETLTTVLLLSHERGHTGQSRVSTCTAGHHTVPGKEIKKSLQSCTVPDYVLSINKHRRETQNFLHEKFLTRKFQCNECSKMFKVVFHPNRHPTSKCTRKKNSPKSPSKHIHDSLLFDFRFSMFT